MYYRLPHFYQCVLVRIAYSTFISGNLLLSLFLILDTDIVTTYVGLLWNNWIVPRGGWVLPG